MSWWSIVIVMATWVDLSKELPGASTSPDRTTPVPFGGESDYMRMLREAQVRTTSNYCVMHFSS